MGADVLDCLSRQINQERVVLVEPLHPTPLRRYISRRLHGCCLWSAALIYSSGAVPADLAFWRIYNLSACEMTPWRGGRRGRATFETSRENNGGSPKTDEWEAS